MIEETVVMDDVDLRCLLMLLLMAEAEVLNGFELGTGNGFEFTAVNKPDEP